MQTEFTDHDPEENTAGRLLWEYLDEAQNLHERIMGWKEPEAGSAFLEDYKLAPEVFNALPIKFMLSGGVSCFRCLEPWAQTKRENGEVSTKVPDFGGFALLRNSIEYSAKALWLMAPASSQHRVERMLLDELEEARLARNFAKSRGVSTDAPQEKMDRIYRYAKQAGISTIQPPGAAKTNGIKRPSYPKTTGLLEEIERYRPSITDYDMSWSAAWQLSSGFAHGKWWANAAAGQITPQLQMQDGAPQVLVSTSLKGLLAVGLACFTLVEAGIKRYEELLHT